MDRGDVEKAAIAAFLILSVVMMYVGAYQFRVWARGRRPDGE